MALQSLISKRSPVRKHALIVMALRWHYFSICVLTSNLIVQLKAYMRSPFLLFILSCSTLCCTGIQAQDTTLSTDLFKTLPANPTFEQRSSTFKKLWGQNRRKEWATEVTVPVIFLDKVFGGLTPHKAGGGNETKSLQLRSATGKEYSIRSVNKSRNDVIPPEFEKTFMEDIIRDGVSQSHPYAAMALAGMQDAAGILHPEPMLVYIPSQPALDSFNTKYGGDLYFLEQRPDGDWSDTKKLGALKEYADTEAVIEALLTDNENKADQYAFVKARLFDMLIGDWDRHDGNWKWGIDKKNKGLVFIPIPRDRDQAFYTHNGVLIDRFLPLAGLSFMQHFDHRVKNISPLNKAGTNMDLFFTNSLSADDWRRAATELRALLTDEVIEKSVHNLPAEIYSVSGKEIEAKLKSRRELLPQFAQSYYKKVAKEVQVVGSNKKEFFSITTNEARELSVRVYNIDSTGQPAATAFYDRTFKPGETNEVRLFGMDGGDIFHTNTTNSTIRMRIIGGAGFDSLVHSNGNIHIYDDHNNYLQVSKARLHLSEDSAVHRFEYKSRKLFSNGPGPVLSYNNKDRIFVGLNVSYKNNKWTRGSVPVKQDLGVYYSLSQQAIRAAYTASKLVFKQKANLFFTGEYDAVRWTNFYGLGNETKEEIKNVRFYRMLGEDWSAAIGLTRTTGNNTFELLTFLQHVDLRNDTSKFVFNNFQSLHPDVYNANKYVGFRLGYTFASLNDRVVPTKGLVVLANGKLVRNISANDYFQQYALRTKFYLPVGKKLSFAFTAGGETIVDNRHMNDNAQLYQHAVIGGPQSLRGYRLERFWGKSSFYNSNEIRYITHLKSYLLNAKIGILAFVDDGRVWMPGEQSNTLHTSYGTGLILAPFNKLCLEVTYGVSTEARLVQLKLSSAL
jgi:hypothetical protein